MGQPLAFIHGTFTFAQVLFSLESLQQQAQLMANLVERPKKIRIRRIQMQAEKLQHATHLTIHLHRKGYRCCDAAQCGCIAAGKIVIIEHIGDPMTRACFPDSPWQPPPRGEAELSRSLHERLHLCPL